MVLTHSDAQGVEVVELSPAEETAYIDAECRRLLNMGVDEFRRRWEAGEYVANSDPRVTQVAMLLA